MKDPDVLIAVLLSVPLVIALAALVYGNYANPVRKLNPKLLGGPRKPKEPRP